MYHFFAPEAASEDGILILSGENAHHIGRVLRLAVGERVVVSDGQDCDRYCEIAGYRGRDVVLRVLPESVPEAELPVRIRLFQGVPKSDKMEWIVQKAVELGAAGIVPVQMKRCVVKLDEKQKTARRERWQKLAESAAKQSGRRVLPAVGPVMTFREAAAEAASADRILVPYESADDMEKTRQLLGSLRPGMSVAVFIGPEGGFDPEEIRILQEAGAEIITLGRRILRTETAGMAFLAMCLLMTEQ